MSMSKQFTGKISQTTGTQYYAVDFEDGTSAMVRRVSDTMHSLQVGDLVSVTCIRDGIAEIKPR